MKNRIFLLFSLLGTFSFAQMDSASIVINENDSINEVRNTLLGYNNNFFAQEMMLEDDHVTYRPEFESVYSRASHHLQRMSGLASQYHDWKLGIVMPTTSRVPQPDPFGGNYVPYYGIVEWISKIREYNPNTAFVWALNMKKMTSVDHADLAEFLLYTGSSNPNGGEDYRQTRIDVGLGTDAVNISFIELGNELEVGTNGFTVQQYIDSSLNVIAAMRAIEPNLKFAAHVATQPWSDVNWKDWHREVLKGMAEEIDYLAFHSYYEGIAVKTMEIDYINQIKKDIGDTAYCSNPDIKVVVTEHARWITSNQHQDDMLKGCLAMAHFLTRMTQHPEVSHCMYHCMLCNSWNVIAPNNNSIRDRYPTGTFHVTEMLSGAFENGQSILSSTVSGTLTDWKDVDATLVNTTVRRADGGLNLVLINKSADNDRHIDFTFDRPYYLNKQVIMTADSMNDYNTDQDTAAVRITTTDVHSTQALTSYQLTSKSLTILYLDTAAFLNQIVEVGGNVGFSIVPNPAKEQIVIMIDADQASKEQAVLEVYNVYGQLVEQIFNQQLTKGSHHVQWDATSQTAGVYFFRLQIDGRVVEQKLILQ